MRVEDRRVAPRRLLALAGLLMAVAAVVLFVTDPAGDGDGATERLRPGDEAGSKFRDQARAERDTTLLDALRPVIGPRRADVPRGLPLPRAAAKVLAIGFDGRTPTRRMRQRFGERDWGAIVVGVDNYASPSQLRSLRLTASRAARRARHESPLLAADPRALGALGPASQVELGIDGTQAQARREARDAGRRMLRAGIGLVLAPSADLGVGGGPAEDRAFSDDPMRAAALVRGAVGGYGDARVAAAPGRFPGEGAASQDPLAGAATVGLSLDELIARDLRPFAGVAAYAPAMQMSAALYAAWDGVTPATLLPDAVRLLRRRLGFEGAVVSADLVAATAATGGGVGDAAVQALKAGCDLLLIPGGRTEQDAAYRAILTAVRSGEIPRKRLDEAVRRVRALSRGRR
jgi:beta-N-acetylhexosaminidase